MLRRMPYDLQDLVASYLDTVSLYCMAKSGVMEVGVEVDLSNVKTVLEERAQFGDIWSLSKWVRQLPAKWVNEIYIDLIFVSLAFRRYNCFSYLLDTWKIDKDLFLKSDPGKKDIEITNPLRCKLCAAALITEDDHYIVRLLETLEKHFRTRETLLSSTGRYTQLIRAGQYYLVDGEAELNMMCKVHEYVKNWWGVSWQTENNRLNYELLHDWHLDMLLWSEDLCPKYIHENSRLNYDILHDIYYKYIL